MVPLDVESQRQLSWGLGSLLTGHLQGVGSWENPVLLLWKFCSPFVCVRCSWGAALQSPRGLPGRPHRAARWAGGCRGLSAHGSNGVSHVLESLVLTRGPQERLFLCLQILGSQELRSSGYNTFGSKKFLRSLCG